MWNLLRRKKGNLVFILFLIGCTAKQPVESVTVIEKPSIETLEVDTVNILSQKKLELTTQYCKEHYGFNSNKLDTPRIVVVHYTAIDNLDATLNLFKKDLIHSSRDYIKDFSSLNVGIHYVVDKDGSIYHLMPDTIVARHLIGFIMCRWVSKISRPIPPVSLPHRLKAM